MTTRGHHGLLLADGSGPAPPVYRSRLQFGGADASTTFVDDEGANWSAFGNAQIDTSLGDQRGLFDGSGDYITTPNAARFQFGTGNFKISFIQRFASKTGFQTIVAKGYTPVSAGDWLIQTGNGDGRINFYSLSPSASLIVGESTGTINTAQDYLIEIERVGTTVTLKRDGSTISTATSSFNFNGTGNMAMGGGSSTAFNNFWFNGWMKDFFIQ